MSIRELGMLRYRVFQAEHQRRLQVAEAERQEQLRAQGQTDEPVDPDPALHRTLSWEAYGSVRVYGAIAARWWYGTPGASEWEGKSALLYQPLYREDVASVEEDMKRALVSYLAHEIQASSGLEYSDGAPDLARIEYLVSWEADGTLVERVRRFEGGYIRGERVDPSTLTSRDISELVARHRRVGLV